MGTISDKLMRIINTKEDIRKALISKGYDVPTSIPFKEYAKMILDLPCKADSFPDIEGIVARYSASGITNEQMAANPVWVDKTGNGHDLQLKNFSWKGMSGIGGYVADIDEWGTNSTAAYFERNSIKITATFKENASLGLLYHNIKLRQSCVLKVTGIPEGCDAFLDDRLGNRFYMSEDGVYEIIPSNFLAEALYLSIEKYPERWYGSKLTIEQLPLYPGALVFDGVDDYGTCDNFPILTKEKGYTVVALRKWLTPENKTDDEVLVANFKKPKLGAEAWGAFGCEIKYNNTNPKIARTLSFGSMPVINVNENNVLLCQTSNNYNGVDIASGNDTGGPYLLICSGGRILFANAAIWELIILDHDATEEELTKIKDYFVKTYPWLFPDQAWTVVGKTNEDKDRATIANITGNGNDLILSNFGFIEGSGYNEEGEYAGYLVTDGVDDKAVSKQFKFGKNFTVILDFKFPVKKISYCGFDLSSKVRIQNLQGSGVYVVLKGNKTLIPSNVVRAVTSEGKVYDENWNEYNIVPGNISSNYTMVNLGFDGSNQFAESATKLAGIYSSILSKDECIKAYNYLQTLKSK